MTTFLAETFADEVGHNSGAVTRSLVSTLGYVCGLMVTTMVSDVSDEARRDALTGLENRRAWDESLIQMKGIQFSVAMIDLDGLKAINDFQGHEAGDDHIKKFAGDLRAAILEPGRAYRFAGDEYAVLLPRGSTESLREVLRNLADQQGVAKFSFGVANIDETDGDFAALVVKADERMYEMKRERKAAAAAAAAATTVATTN